MALAQVGQTRVDTVAIQRRVYGLQEPARCFLGPNRHPLFNRVPAEARVTVSIRAWMGVGAGLEE